MAHRVPTSIPDYGDVPVTAEDLEALTPESILKFATDCVETTTRFFRGCGNIDGLKGNLPETIHDVIEIVRHQPKDSSAITAARERAQKSAEWIEKKAETDVRHQDSRYDYDTAPDEDNAYDTLYLICLAAAQLAQTAIAVAGSQSPAASARDVASLAMRAATGYAGAGHYYNDDFQREHPRIRGETLAEIQSHFAQAALCNDSALRDLMPTREPPAGLVEVVGAISRELIIYLQQHPRELYNIRPRQFEHLIAEVLASFGWNVELTPQSRDGGYDIYAISTDLAAGTTSSWIIECKKYSADNKVGIDIVRSLYGLRNTLQVGGAMVATTTHFSRDALRFRNEKASRYDLHLRDYESVVEWISKYRARPQGRLHLDSKP